MFDFFDKIVGFFEMIWNLIVNLVNSLLMILGTIVQIPLIVNNWALFLPSVIYAGVLITISFAVVKFVVGR